MSNLQLFVAIFTVAAVMLSVFCGALLAAQWLSSHGHPALALIFVLGFISAVVAAFLTFIARR
jgi:hypothetical protein